MTNKANRSDKTRRNRRILVSGVAIFLVMISVLAYVSSLHQPAGNPGPGPAQYASSEYFTISDVAGTYKPVAPGANATNPGGTIHIDRLGFTFTPIKGPATDVAIFMPGMEDPTNHYWAGITIPNGTATAAGDIQPTYALPSQRQDDGTYQLTIRLRANEADGNIVLTFTPEVNLFPG